MEVYKSIDGFGRIRYWKKGKEVHKFESLLRTYIFKAINALIDWLEKIKYWFF